MPVEFSLFQELYEAEVKNFHVNKLKQMLESKGFAQLREKEQKRIEKPESFRLTSDFKLLLVL